MNTTIEKLFGFDSQKHNVRTEIMAGITTFLTMAYILAVNPSIFSALPEMPGGSVFTATALAAIIGTLVMGSYVTINVRADGASLQFNIDGKQQQVNTADITAPTTSAAVRMRLAGKIE